MVCAGAVPYRQDFRLLPGSSSSSKRYDSAAGAGEGGGGEDRTVELPEAWLRSVARSLTLFKHNIARLLPLPAYSTGLL